jgi:nucleoside-diphosphate-sugar epimerase
MLLDRPDLVGETINIASGQDISIRQLIDEIIDLIGYKAVSIEYMPERPGDVKRHIANTLKAKDLLGFKPTIDIREGLKKTIEFYMKQ